MATRSPFIRQHLVTSIFYPDREYFNPSHMKTILVMGNELASRTKTESGRLGDHGRLAQNIAKRLGIITCAYERLGTGQAPASWQLRRTMQNMHQPDAYADTMAYVGHEIASRLRGMPELRYKKPILIGKSGGATYGIGIARANTLQAECGVFIDPAGMFSMGGTFRAAMEIVRYKRAIESTVPKPVKPYGEGRNAEPTSLSRTIRDFYINGIVASSDCAKHDLRNVPIPVAVDVPEYGLYYNVPGVSLPQLVDKLQGPEYPNVTAELRLGASHDWYNGSDKYATAVRNGLQLLGYWGLNGNHI
jgi:hypothetical protein